MSHPFDSLTEEQLRTTSGAKWNRYPADVLPLWVADMDFPVAEPIRAAIRDHAGSDDFGYPQSKGIPGLLDALTTHLRQRHGVSFSAEQVVPTSGIIPSLYLSTMALSAPGDEVIVQPPAYPPFRMAVEGTGRRVLNNPLRETAGHWSLDLEQLEDSISPATRMLILCNPHNPTGRVFTAAELEALGELVLRHNLWVVSDELHADLVLQGRHIPFASLSDELAQRTITLFGPTKTFNIAGLKVGFVLSHNPALLERLAQQSAGVHTPRNLLAQAAGVLTPPNVLAQAAARAAFTQCSDWHESTLEYLRGNCRLLAELVAAELPGVRFTPPEGTYLAWLDFRAVIDEAELEAFLLEEARVALGLGSGYGPGGEGFARMNLATSRQIIRQAVERIAAALRKRG